MKLSKEELQEMVKEAENILAEYHSTLKEVEAIDKMPNDEEFTSMALSAIEKALKDWLLRTAPFMPEEEEPGIVMSYKYKLWKALGDELKSKGWTK
jgi:hypothetical protein